MKNFSKDPAILQNFVKRKNRLENCYDSDESDSAEFMDENEMKDYLGSDYLGSVDSTPDDSMDLDDPSEPDEPAPTPSALPSYVTGLPVINTSSPNLAVPAYLTDAAPAPPMGQNKFESTPNLFPTPPPSDIAPAPPKEKSPLAATLPTDSPGPTPDKALLPSQMDKGARPSSKAKATLKRPPPTNRSTKRSANNNKGGAAVRERANKRVIKQQMAVLRELGAKAQKRMAKQERIHSKERDQIVDQAKRANDQIIKNTETQRKNLEKNQKKERDAIVATQLREQRNQTKETDLSDKALQKELRDRAKVSAKNHSAKQKALQKEHKLKLKQSKKGTSSSGLKAMKKEQKVEIALGDMMHSLVLLREQKFEETSLEWQNNIAYDKTICAQIEATQSSDTDMLKQQMDLELENLTSIWNNKFDEQQKLFPVIQRQMKEVHDLQKTNLAAQLEVEKAQQLTLLRAEHKILAKEVADRKKVLTKVADGKNKQIGKGIGMSKADIKLKQNETKQQLFEDCQKLDKEYENTTTTQLTDEQEDISLYQKRVMQQLTDRQQEEYTELVNSQAKAKYELKREQIDECLGLTKEYHEKQMILLEQQHAAQTSLQDKQHTERLTLLRNQHKNCITLVENQRQELLAFLQKQLSGEPNQIFQDRVEKEISEVLETRQAENKKMQTEVSELMEQEQRDLKQTQFQIKQKYEETNRADVEKIEAEQATNIPPQR